MYFYWQNLKSGKFNICFEQLENQRAAADDSVGYLREKRGGGSFYRF